MPAFNFDDAFVRERFEQIMTEESVYKSALWNSGAIAIDTSLAAMVGSGDGRIFTKRFYRDLGEPAQSETGDGGSPEGVFDQTNGPEYPDDSNTPVTTYSLADAELSVTKSGPLASWDIQTIQRRFNFMTDPMGVVETMLSEYWAKYLDKHAVAIMTGLINQNIATDGSDSVLDIGNVANAPDVTNTIQPDTIITAEDLIGDAANFNTIVMHSRVYNNLRIQNLIDFIPSSDGRVNFSLYQGKIVMVSDQVEVDRSGANPVYTTYMMGEAVLAYGSSLAQGPNEAIIGFERWRDPRMGRGAGLDQIISRAQYALHPMGYSWLDAAVTGSKSVGATPIYPNLVNMRDVTNWERKAASNKLVGWVAIRSNG